MRQFPYSNCDAGPGPFFKAVEVIGKQPKVDSARVRGEESRPASPQQLLNLDGLWFQSSS